MTPSMLFGEVCCIVEIVDVLCASVGRSSAGDIDCVIVDDVDDDVVDDDKLVVTCEVFKFFNCCKYLR